MGIGRARLSDVGGDQPCDEPCAFRLGPGLGRDVGPPPESLAVLCCHGGVLGVHRGVCAPKSPGCCRRCISDEFDRFGDGFGAGDPDSSSTTTAGAASEFSRCRPFRCLHLPRQRSGGSERRFGRQRLFPFCLLPAVRRGQRSAVGCRLPKREWDFTCLALPWAGVWAGWWWPGVGTLG